VRGIPIFRDNLPFAAERPEARRHEKDLPNLRPIDASILPVAHLPNPKGFQKGISFRTNGERKRLVQQVVLKVPYRHFPIRLQTMLFQRFMEDGKMRLCPGVEAPEVSGGPRKRNRSESVLGRPFGPQYGGLFRFGTGKFAAKKHKSRKRRSRSSCIPLCVSCVFSRPFFFCLAGQNDKG
jgi:hypothetical protein